LGVTCVVNAMGTEHSLGCRDNVELAVKTIGFSYKSLAKIRNNWGIFKRI
jgi:hypothetical protein